MEMTEKFRMRRYSKKKNGHKYIRAPMRGVNENYLQYVQSRWGLRTSSMLRAG